jgi:hypothetical protein
VISKIWRIFPKTIRKISPIYTRKIKNGRFFFQIFDIKNFGEFFQKKLTKLVQFTLENLKMDNFFFQFFDIKNLANFSKNN